MYFGIKNIILVKGMLHFTKLQYFIYDFYKRYILFMYNKEIYIILILF